MGVQYRCQPTMMPGRAGHPATETGLAKDVTSRALPVAGFQKQAFTTEKPADHGVPRSSRYCRADIQ